MRCVVLWYCLKTYPRAQSYYCIRSVPQGGDCAQGEFETPGNSYGHFETWDSGRRGKGRAEFEAGILVTGPACYTHLNATTAAYKATRTGVSTVTDPELGHVQVVSLTMCRFIVALQLFMFVFSHCLSAAQISAYSFFSVSVSVARVREVHLLT